MRLVAWNRGLWRHPDVNMPVTMRTYSVRERAGEPDSRYFDLSFTEYRRPQLLRRGYRRNRGHDLPALVFIDRHGVAHELDLDEESGGVSANPRTGVTIGTRAHPATLRRLSKRYYGENGEWKRIARKNSIHHMGADDTLDKLHKRGRKHMRLTIPRIKPRIGIEPAKPVGGKERH